MPQLPASRALLAALTSMVFLAIIASSGGCATESERKAIVFVASSVQDAVDELVADFEREHPLVQIQVHRGASGALRRQLEHVPGVDVFLSADVEEFEPLIEGSRVSADDVREFLANELVLVAARGEGESPRSRSLEQILHAATRIAIGHPDSVPAGRYARSWLQATGKWQPLESRLVPTPNVRAAVAAVRSGGADLAVVYVTDAALFDDVVVVHRVREEERGAPEIRYAVAPLEGASAIGIEFYCLLLGEPARRVFAERGFVPLAVSPPLRCSEAPNRAPSAG